MILIKVIVLAGENCIEDDTDDCCYCQTREGEGNTAEGDLDVAGVTDTDGKNQNESGDDNIAGIGEVNLIFNNVADTDCGNHTIEHQRHAANGCGGH